MSGAELYQTSKSELARAVELSILETDNGRVSAQLLVSVLGLSEACVWSEIERAAAEFAAANGWRV